MDKPKAESRQLKQSIKKIEGINVDDAFVPSSVFRFLSRDRFQL